METSSSSPRHAPFPFTTWLGVILLFVFFGLLVAVLVRIAPRGNTYEAKRAKAREEKLKTAMDEAHKDLTTYGWVDKSKGVARIPISRAMQLALAELAQKKPEPAGPIETPAPAQQLPGPSPAASGSPGQAPAPAVGAPSAATQTGASQPSATPSAPPQPSVTPKPTSVSGKDSENRNQPAAAANPPGAQPGTQPGASASPLAAPAPPSGQPAVSPTGTPKQSPSGSPLPVPEKTP
jgi:hypothetical protein